MGKLNLRWFFSFHKSQRHLAASHWEENAVSLSSAKPGSWHGETFVKSHQLYPHSQQGPTTHQSTWDSHSGEGGKVRLFMSWIHGSHGNVLAPPQKCLQSNCPCRAITGSIAQRSPAVCPAKGKGATASCSYPEYLSQKKGQNWRAEHFGTLMYSTCS